MRKPGWYWWEQQRFYGRIFGFLALLALAYAAGQRLGWWLWWGR